MKAVVLRLVYIACAQGVAPDTPIFTATGSIEPLVALGKKGLIASQVRNRRSMPAMSSPLSVSPTDLWKSLLPATNLSFDATGEVDSVYVPAYYLKRTFEVVVALFAKFLDAAKLAFIRSPGTWL